MYTLECSLIVRNESARLAAPEYPIIHEKLRPSKKKTITQNILYIYRYTPLSFVCTLRKRSHIYHTPNSWLSLSLRLSLINKYAQSAPEPTHIVLIARATATHRRHISLYHIRRAEEEEEEEEGNGFEKHTGNRERECDERNQSEAH